MSESGDKSRTIAAAVMKRVGAKFTFREGTNYTLRHRLSVARLPMDVHLDATRQIERETLALMRAKQYNGSLHVVYGDGCREHYLGCGIMVRLVASKNRKQRGFGRQRSITRNIPLAQYSQD